MTNYLALAFFAVGLVAIIKGGDLFVDASRWIAEVSGIPKFIIGATVVSFATTLPELTVSSIATYRCLPEIATGNAIGSVTANIGLIMGISLVSMPFTINRKKTTVKSLLMISSCLVIMIFTRNNEFTFFPAIVLAIIFIIFVADNIYAASFDKDNTTSRPVANKKSFLTNIFKFIFGLSGILIGANLLVDNGKIIATDILHIPQSIVAVTFVAIGTSLPELITTVTAIAKKESSLSVGNIIGANIIDMTMILPICSVISGGSLLITPQTIKFDMPYCMVEILIATVPTLLNGKFTRFQGFACLLIYIMYLYNLFPTIIF